MRKPHRSGFTLVELLVVIAIIALLVAVLLPVLGRARAAGNAIKCASNLRNIAQALLMHAQEHKQTLPAAYTYRPGPEWGSRPPDQYPQPTHGYIHWSSYIMGSTPGRVLSELFRCPALTDGGLPATNPPDGDLISGQVRDPAFTGTEYDAQVSRCAITVNEALMPRNKFNKSIRGASPSSKLTYQYVKTTMVKNSTNVILATEFWDNWRIVSEVASEEEAPVVKSHRPVSGYYCIVGKGTDLVAGVSPTAGPIYARVTKVDNPVRPSDGVSNTLGWVGRNHGGSNKTDAGGRNLGTTTFVYLDGHVETKTIEETLTPNFQWGDRFGIYSLPGAYVNPK
jgi:prepilin-type N-terminal cleavage/methylation domain-containing protein